MIEALRTEHLALSDENKALRELVVDELPRSVSRRIIADLESHPLRQQAAQAKTSGMDAASSMSQRSPYGASNYFSDSDIGSTQGSTRAGNQAERTEHRSKFMIEALRTEHLSLSDENKALRELVVDELPRSVSRRLIADLESHPLRQQATAQVKTSSQGAASPMSQRSPYGANNYFSDSDDGSTQRSRRGGQQAERTEHRSKFMIEALRTEHLALSDENKALRDLVVDELPRSVSRRLIADLESHPLRQQAAQAKTSANPNAVSPRSPYSANHYFSDSDDGSTQRSARGGTQGERTEHRSKFMIEALRTEHLALSDENKTLRELVVDELPRSLSRRLIADLESHPLRQQAAQAKTSANPSAVSQRSPYGANNYFSDSDDGSTQRSTRGGKQAERTEHRSKFMIEALRTEHLALSDENNGLRELVVDELPRSVSRRIIADLESHPLRQQAAQAKMSSSSMQSAASPMSQRSPYGANHYFSDSDVGSTRGRNQAERTEHRSKFMIEALRTEHLSLGDENQTLRDLVTTSLPKRIARSILADLDSHPLRQQVTQAQILSRSNHSVSSQSQRSPYYGADHPFSGSDVGSTQGSTRGRNQGERTEHRSKFMIEALRTEHLSLSDENQTLRDLVTISLPKRTARAILADLDSHPLRQQVTQAQVLSRSNHSSSSSQPRNQSVRSRGVQAPLSSRSNHSSASASSKGQLSLPGVSFDTETVSKDFGQPQRTQHRTKFLIESMLTEYNALTEENEDLRYLVIGELPPHVSRSILNELDNARKQVTDEYLASPQASEQPVVEMDFAEAMLLGLNRKRNGASDSVSASSSRGRSRAPRTEHRTKFLLESLRTDHCALSAANETLRDLVKDNLPPRVVRSIMNDLENNRRKLHQKASQPPAPSSSGDIEAELLGVNEEMGGQPEVRSEHRTKFMLESLRTEHLSLGDENKTLRDLVANELSPRAAKKILAELDSHPLRMQQKATAPAQATASQSPKPGSSLQSHLSSNKSEPSKPDQFGFSPSWSVAEESTDSAAPSKNNKSSKRQSLQKVLSTSRSVTSEATDRAANKSYGNNASASKKKDIAPFDKAADGDKEKIASLRKKYVNLMTEVRQLRSLVKTTMPPHVADMILRDDEEEELDSTLPGNMARATSISALQFDVNSLWTMTEEPEKMNEGGDTFNKASSTASKGASSTTSAAARMWLTNDSEKRASDNGNDNLDESLNTSSKAGSGTAAPEAPKNAEGSRFSFWRKGRKN
jgi:hypothetical protein